jgi:hypothetical protein
MLRSLILGILTGVVLFAPTELASSTSVFSGVAAVKFTLNNQNIKKELLSVNPAGAHEIVAVWECGRQGVPAGILNFGRMGVSVDESTAGPYGDGRWDSVWFSDYYGGACPPGASGVTILPFEANAGDAIYWRIEGEAYKTSHGDLRRIWESGTMVLQ